MKTLLIKSVHDAWDYVMEHYYCFGEEACGIRKDSYAIISIQDTHTEGFGFQFTENQFCKAVLTLHFDDIVREVEGAVLFDADMAAKIIAFVEGLPAVDTLLVHCYGGQSRSRAVGAFILHMLGRDNSAFFKRADPNQHVYETLLQVWEKRK